MTGRFGRLRGLRFWHAAGARDFGMLWASEAISALGDQFQRRRPVVARDLAYGIWPRPGMWRVMGLVMSTAPAGVLIDVSATALFLGAGALMVVTTLCALALGMVELFDAPRGQAVAGGAPSE